MFLKKKFGFPLRSDAGMTLHHVVTIMRSFINAGSNDRMRATQEMGLFQHAVNVHVF
jgi:hypothetical protein